PLCPRAACFSRKGAWLMKDRLNCLLICCRRELRRASRSDVRNWHSVYGRTRRTDCELPHLRHDPDSLNICGASYSPQARCAKTLRVGGPATDARKARKELLAWTRRRQT